MHAGTDGTERKEMDLEIVSLRAKLEELKDDEASLTLLRDALSRFTCAKNPDEEKFIREKAISFENLKKARTYLVIHDNEIIAFFAVSFKSIDLEGVSKSKRKDMTAGEPDVKTYSAFLIGHLAKKDGVPFRLGEYLLDMSLDLICEAQKLIGGRLAYLDCKNEPGLISLYESYGFKHFKTNTETGLEQFYIKI